jgi:hypothetical protein
MEPNKLAQKQFHKQGSFEEIWSVIVLIVVLGGNYTKQNEVNLHKRYLNRFKLDGREGNPNSKLSCCVNLFDYLAEKEYLEIQIKNLAFSYTKLLVRYSFTFHSLSVIVELSIAENNGSIDIAPLNNHEKTTLYLDELKNQIEAGVS